MSDQQTATSSGAQEVQTSEAQNENLSRIRQQVEYYFSKENLSRDSYLVSKMNSQLFVPLSEIAQFKHLRQLTDDINTIIKAVAHSDKVILSSDNKMIKPNMEPPQRKTVILRDIPSGTSEEDIRALFDIGSIPDASIESANADIGNTYRVTFNTESVALRALDICRTKSIAGASVSAYIKPESLTTFFASSTSQSAKPAGEFPLDSNPLGAPSGFSSGGAPAPSSFPSNQEAQNPPQGGAPGQADQPAPGPYPGITGAHLTELGFPPELAQAYDAGDPNAQAEVWYYVAQNQMYMYQMMYQQQFPGMPSRADIYRTDLPRNPISSSALSGATNMRGADAYYGPHSSRGRNAGRGRYRGGRGGASGDRSGKDAQGDQKQTGKESEKTEQQQTNSPFYYKSSSSSSSSSSSTTPAETPAATTEKPAPAKQQKEKGGKKNKDETQKGNAKANEKGKNKAQKKNSNFTYTSQSASSAPASSNAPSNKQDAFSYKKNKSEPAPPAAAQSHKKGSAKIPSLDSFPALKRQIGYEGSFKKYSRESIRSICFEMALPECPDPAYDIIDQFHITPVGPLPPESLVNLVLLVKEEQKMNEMMNQAAEQEEQEAHRLPLSAGAAPFHPKGKGSSSSSAAAAAPEDEDIHPLTAPDASASADDDFSEDDGTATAAAAHVFGKDPLDSFEFVPGPLQPSTTTHVTQLSRSGSPTSHANPQMSPAMQLKPSPSPSLGSLSLSESIHSALTIGSPAIPSQGLK